MPDTDPRGVIAHQIRRLIWATVLLALALTGTLGGGLVYVQVSQQRDARLATENRAADARQRRTLGEVCRRDNLQLGVLEAEIALFEFGLASPTPAQALARTTNLAALRGFRDALMEKPACPEIPNP